MGGPAVNGAQERAAKPIPAEKHVTQLLESAGGTRGKDCLGESRCGMQDRDPPLANPVGKLPRICIT